MPALLKFRLLDQLNHLGNRCFSADVYFRQVDVELLLEQRNQLETIVDHHLAD